MPPSGKDSLRATAGRETVPRMPFTPEALAKRAQLAAVYGWFRQRIVLLIVCIMLFLQFMTWRAIDRLYIPSPPDCSSRSPCYVLGTVSVQGTVSLDSTTIRLISK
jgi:hypothetical protein